MRILGIKSIAMILLFYALLFVSCSRSSGDNSVEATARITDFETTGFLKDAKDPLLFHSLRAFDGDPVTCWVEGEGLSGTGESVTVIMEKQVRVDAVAVIPGFFDERLFRKNNRLKSAVLKLDEFSIDLAFRDEMILQTTELKRPVDATKITLTIGDVYRGTDWDNTCVAEIELLFKKNKIALIVPFDELVKSKKIKTVMTAEIHDSPGRAIVPIREKFVYSYGEHGYLVKKAKFVKDTPMEYDTYEYDKAGNVTTVVTFTGSGDIFSSIRYEYDDSNQPLLKIYLNMNGEEYQREEYTYDDKGKTTSERLLYNDGEEKSYKEYSYIYKNGLVIESKATKKDGSVYKKSVYSTDGVILQNDFYDALGKSISKQVYTFDGTSHLIDISDYSLPDNMKLGSITFAYSVAGDLLSETETRAGNLISKKTYAYKAIVY